MIEPSNIFPDPDDLEFTLAIEDGDQRQLLFAGMRALAANLGGCDQGQPALEGWVAKAQTLRIDSTKRQGESRGLP